MKWFKKFSAKPKFDLLTYGSLKLGKDRKGYSWEGMVQFPNLDDRIELAIEVEDKNKPSKEHVEIINDFMENWEKVEDDLLTHLATNFKNSIWAKSKAELRKIYFLASLELKRNKEEFWLVFEPNFNEESIFNFLPRFTIRNKKIIWSNVT